MFLTGLKQATCEHCSVHMLFLCCDQLCGHLVVVTDKVSMLVAGIVFIEGDAKSHVPHTPCILALAKKGSLGEA